MQIKKIKEMLSSVALEYPDNLVPEQLKDIPRIAFNISLTLGTRTPSDLRVCDVGGGIGMFSIGCAALGFKEVVLCDDFQDYINKILGDSIFHIHRKYNVRIVTGDVIKEGLKVEGKFDAITSFDSMEHWHHSPKRLFHQAASMLSPNGLFVLSVPNCVNLRKRITIPFGIGKWTALDDWYEKETFRGHVREPDVRDLLYIARDMGLKNVRIYGRNWQGYFSRSKMVRLATRIVDLPLRLKPSLCSNIYLKGCSVENLMRHA
jgi:2-polyprenyl-3-methyl-5-hydroxy-6-metoxy-1,4-benzoquinol methylase